MEEVLYTSDMPQDNESEKTPSPPYISLLTFTNFLIWLETEGVPLQFDGSFWRRKYSGSTGFQLMSGLRFLGLLKGDKPQPILEDLVESKGDDRKAKLADVIKKSYTKVDFDALPRGTPKMLTDWFRDYRLEGDTLRKAESFFINACKFVDIPLSPSLRKKARNKPTKSTAVTQRGKTQRKKTSTLSQEEKEAVRKDSIDEEGQVSRIELTSGGTVKLTVNVDLFRLSRDDRDFVLKLVDIVKGYGNKEESAQEDIPL